MKKGKFLIVNEPSIESVDQQLKFPAEKCDIFPAQVYIPQSNKKMEKGLFCVVASLTQIAICITMIVFFSWGYILPVVIEIFFFAMYAKEHVWVLTVQIYYLMITLLGTVAVLIISFAPETSGTRKDLEFVMPTLEKKILVPIGIFFGAYTCLRVILVASYYTQLFYSNLRDKFASQKVVLQPL